MKRYYDLSHHFWLFVIATGLIAQAFRSSEMSPYQTKILDDIEVAVSTILLTEMLLRIISDYRGFQKLRRNWIDLILAIIAFVISLPGIRRTTRAYDWFTIFSIIRIYRVVWAIPVTRNLLVSLTYLLPRDYY